MRRPTLEAEPLPSNEKYASAFSPPNVSCLMLRRCVSRRARGTGQSRAGAAGAGWPSGGATGRAGADIAHDNGQAADHRSCDTSRTLAAERTWIAHTRRDETHHPRRHGRVLRVGRAARSAGPAAASPSPWAADPTPAASSPPRATKRGSSACARPFRCLGPCASARSWSSSRPNFHEIPSGLAAGLRDLPLGHAACRRPFARRGVPRRHRQFVERTAWR